MTHVEISIIVVTKNRQEKLLHLLKSLPNSTFKKFELIIVDQSTDGDWDGLNKVKKQLKRFSNVVFIKSDIIGKSRGLNLALQASSAPICAFTDDDCVVDKNWTKNIWHFFKTNFDVAGVFGNTYPYKPKNRDNLICPAVFTRTTMQIFKNPHVILHESLGQGNNMSIRKSAFYTIGCFKEWLGTGSISQAAEDNDIIFRLLSSGHTLATNPKMIVYHDKWLTPKEEALLQRKYTCGTIAFCMYYFVRKLDWWFISAIQVRLKTYTYPAWKSVVKRTAECKINRNWVISIYVYIRELTAVARGVFLGTIYACFYRDRDFSVRRYE